MFNIKVIKDNRCKVHLCQDRSHPATFRCSEKLFTKLQRNSVVTNDVVKKHPNHSWLENPGEKSEKKK